jgi:hypothetical protein
LRALALLAQRPQVRKHAASSERKSITHRALKQRERRRRKLTLRNESLHCAVAAARRDQCGCSRSAVECKVERAVRPTERFFRPHERRLHKNEYAQINLLSTQQRSRLLKALQRNAFVELGQHLGVGRLQSHRYFQATAQQIAKRYAVPADKGRMALDDNALEVADPFRNRSMVREGNRRAIKEAAAVVQLDRLRGFQPLQRVFDLLRNHPRRHTPGQRVLP